MRAGQAAVEYVLALCALAVAAMVAWHIARAARANAERTVEHVSADYP